MKIHRFYIPGFSHTRSVVVTESRLINQWTRVLRFRPPQQVVLFDGVNQGHIYQLDSITDREARLHYVAKEPANKPKTEVYLFWSLLKKDKNDWVLQKCTELGVTVLLPVITDRTEKTGFNIERARKIVAEASEQSGRTTLPTVAEPLDLRAVLLKFAHAMDLYVCEQHGSKIPAKLPKKIGVLVGPEGGWSEIEKHLLKEYKVPEIEISQNVLRAETASVAAMAQACYR